MTLNKYTLYDEIDAQQARALWNLSGGFVRDGHGFTYKDGMCISNYSISINQDNFDALLKNADEITYWHYGFNTECGRDVQINVGNTTISVSVKCDMTLDRPDYSG